MVKKAYSDLFENYGEKSWELDSDSLITFFRAADQTTAIVGKRQSKTFATLSALSGHRELPQVKAMPAVKAAKKAPVKIEKVSAKKAAAVPKSGEGAATPAEINSYRDIGLTVRIEINLPSDGDQETYDRIFRSIRENLLNAQ